MFPLPLVAGFGASAQEAPADGGFDAHGFHLAAHDADLRDPIVLRRPGPFTQADWFLSGLFEYAKSPLVREITSEAGTGPAQVEPVVDNLLALNLSAGVAAHERVRFDVMAPIYGLTTGTDLTAQGPAMGDLRGTLTLVAVRPDHVVGGGGPGLALVGHIDAPSGTPGRFLGSGGLGGGGGLALTYEFERATLTADVSSQFNPTADVANVVGSDEVVAGLGVGFLTSDVVGLTIEGVARPSLQANPSEFATLPPAETILSLRYLAKSGAFWTFGAAGGLTDGPGVAAFRVFVGTGYGDFEPPRPADSDPVGVLRATDLCPLESETTNGWKDDDGCPDKLGALQVDVRYRGISRGADAEIIGPDGRQAIRLGPQGLSVDAVPGSQWTVTARDGCLRGEGNTVATEDGARIAIELQPLYDAKVQVEVVGSDDAPLPGAQVTWQSAAPECAPAGIGLVDSTGRLVQDLASGLHVIVVTAPEHNVATQPVEFLPGDDKLVRIKLGASKVVMEKKRIKILEKVQFEFGKAVIKPDSFDLLDQVAAVIITNPDVGRVEVSGHTDNKGSDEFNQKLSEDRANSVREYLATHGVAPERLISVGYGETRPLDTNKTEAGREVNRRVEFNLIDQVEEPTQEGGGATPAPGGPP